MANNTAIYTVVRIKKRDLDLLREQIGDSMNIADMLSIAIRHFVHYERLLERGKEPTPEVMAEWTAKQEITGIIKEHGSIGGTKIG